MTNITCEKKDDEIRLTVKGHAGYAEFGTDIVCSAVSALCFGLLGALGEEDVLKHRVSDGDLRVTIRRCRRTEWMTEVALAGFRQTEKAYPEYVKLTEKVG